MTSVAIATNSSSSCCSLNFTAVTDDDVMMNISDHPVSASNDCNNGNCCLVIQPPMVIDTFSWEDFPVIVQKDLPNLLFATTKSTTTTPAESEAEAVDLCSSVSSSSSMSDDEEVDSLLEDDDCVFDDNDDTMDTTAVVKTVSLSSFASEACTTASSPPLQQQQKQPQQKRVRFATALEVRTYSIVLGDHPLCESLPLSLGWEYQESEFLDLETHEQSKQRWMPYRYGHSNLAAASHGVNRLSYLERKHLLLQVGGYTDQQLVAFEQQQQQQQQQPLKHSQRFGSLQLLNNNTDVDHDEVVMVSAET
ncbi:hypothetical protein IV203_030378 [Nitzschia inconspicua]|uniref:Uncharacterized protein n=1 Tax=Nitzschia inconspicua TaxID=303405 RepID=A0A9K3Q186_9STRA|nr:hypothetical protein IV203_030378 [Nitzschia inconspicua]